MASNNYTLNTWAAKRIIGDASATTADNALLQAGVDGNIWIFGSNRASAYGIRYLYDSSTSGTADKIEFYGGQQENNIDVPSAWIQLDTGDLYVLGNVGIGHEPDTYKLYVNGTSYFDDHITSNKSIWFGANSTSGKAILGYNSTYPKYGIWYFDEATDEATDVMTLSASGNADSKTDADFSINTHGAGTLANRNNRIPHTGNTTGTVGGTEQPVYINAGTITSTTYALKATVNDSTAGYMAYYSAARAVSGTSYAQMIDGCLNLYPANGSYREGIRIHPKSSWSDITLQGNTSSSNTSGIAANDWFIGNNNGNFYIARNGSPGSTAYLSCVSNAWKILGNTTHDGIVYFANGTTYYIDNSGDSRLRYMYTNATIGYESAGIILSPSGTPWPYIRFDTRAGGSTYVTTAQTNWGELYCQVPAKNGSTYYSTRFFFREYSKTANTTTRVGYYEDYYLPTVNDGRSTSVSYDIRTSKSSAYNVDTATRINGNLAAATTDVNRNIWVSSTASADGIPNYISGFNMNPSTKIFTVPSGTRISPSAGALYLGNSDNQSWVYLQDCCSQSGNDKWKITQDGAAVFSGGVTANITGNCSGSSGSCTGNAGGLKSGATLAGPVYFGIASMDACILGYSSTYPNHGIWYKDASVDTMRFSASNNANTDAGADLCINGNGAGTVTIRGNTIIHAGNYTSWCATSGHNHDSTYLKLSGGTLTGNLAVSFAGNAMIESKNTKTGSSVILDSGSSTNHGIYSQGYSPTATTFTADAKWMIYRNSAGTVTVNGNCTGSSGSCTGNAATATTATYVTTANTAGYTTDQYGNFKHQRSTSSDCFSIYNSAGTTKFKVYFETGELVSSSYLQAAQHIYMNAGALKMLYNNTWYDVVSNYNNSNVTMNACSGGLFLGYTTTTSINFLNGKATLNSSGDLTVTGKTRCNKYCDSDASVLIERSSNAAIMRTVAGPYLSIQTDGNLVLYNYGGGSVRWHTNTGSSSYRVKNNINSLTQKDLDNFQKLNPISFYYKPELKLENTNMRYGLIAEEVIKLYPNLVITPPNYKENKFDINKGVSQPLVTLDYEGFIPLLIKMVQNQQKEIEYLKQQISNI